MTNSPELIADAPEIAPLRLHDVAYGAAIFGRSEGWYLTQLRARKLPGHKIGRTWKLTDDDIRQAMELTAVAAVMPVRDPAGLTPTSRRNLTRPSKATRR
jgi:hypothetical protein